MNNFNDFLKAFNQIKQTFKGNPQEAVQKIIAENNISQQELNMLQNTATQIMRFVK